MARRRPAALANHSRHAAQLLEVTVDRDPLGLAVQPGGQPLAAFFAPHLQ